MYYIWTKKKCRTGHRVAQTLIQMSMLMGILVLNRVPSPSDLDKLRDALVQEWDQIDQMEMCHHTLLLLIFGFH